MTTAPDFAAVSHPLRTVQPSTARETIMDTLFDVDEQHKASTVDLFGSPLDRGYDLVQDDPTRDYTALVDSDRSAVVCGDATAVLSRVPTGCVRTVVTSPPYWGLRDYANPDQIGLEETVFDYVDRLVSVFEQVRRVLAQDGTMWLNIGDSYTSGNRNYRDADPRNAARGLDYRPPTPEGMKPKDLIGVPWMLAFALRDAGWYLRTDIVWNKPNGQPESVRDRPTRSHEFLFLLTKSEKYYFDVDGVQGPNGRRNRSVWDINTVPMPEAHDASFPPELVYSCLAHGSERGDLILDPFLGSGTTALVAGGTGRRFLGVELNPEYVAIARRRLGVKVAD